MSSSKGSEDVDENREEADPVELIRFNKSTESDPNSNKLSPLCLDD